MNKEIWIITLFLSFLVAYLPKVNLSDQTTVGSGLRSNGVIDIASLSDSTIAIGTGDGIGIGTFRNGKLILTNLANLKLPAGGFASVVATDNIIAVSGVNDTLILGESFPKGTGISYSFDRGSSWYYKSQPKDQRPSVFTCPYSTNLNQYYQSSDSLICEQECEYPFSCNEPQKNCVKIFDWISWGSQDSIRHLSTTVDIWNVSYNMTIANDYLYAASFTGGLRRLNLSDSELTDWEVIPLPMDSQQTLYCNQIDTVEYEFDVNDSCPRNNNPCDGKNQQCNPYLSGEMNHKVYSVYSDEDTLWVGTANGINKGVVNGECIDWLHINSSNANISGNWVIGFNIQKKDNEQIIYASTWPTNDGEFSSVSYSFNGGLSWQNVEQFRSLGGIKVYELSSDDSSVYAATDNGIYVSDNQKYWEKIQRPLGSDGQQILSDKFYSVESFNNGSLLIVGSDDGLAVTSNKGLTWDVYRSWSNNGDAETISFNPYPNPFYRKYSNTVGNNGNVRFIVYNNGSEIFNSMRIDIFNFSMDKVASITNPVMVDNGMEFIWNGLDNYNQPVPNGTYFCRLEYGNQNAWTKLVVVN